MPEFLPGARLVEADPKPLGQRVPAPLHERVEALCDRVYESGRRRPAKADMVAALLLAASSDPEVLSRALDHYYGARVQHALLGDRPGPGEVVTFPQRKSGPRSGRVG
jgi:hypothetical protein